jgi:asparagine synthase (glutamine-hydrolysing)
MFRYIALSWSLHAPEQRKAADRLDQRLRAASDWQAIHRGSGLRVYITGSQRGVNGVYDLPSGQGVILGKLFRQGRAPSGAADITLTAEEAHRIVHTDGRALVADFWGRYVAFLPSWTGESRVLRDPTGALPCWQMSVDRITIVSSWLEDLAEVLQLPAEFAVDWDVVATLMLMGQFGGKDTALKEVKQILPGEVTTLGRPASSPLVLWNAVDIARRPTELASVEAAEQLREIVRHSAMAWASCYQAILLRLSGGIDSSILLNSLCPAVSPDRITCINYHSPGSDSDERAYARLAADRAGVKLIEQPRDDGFQMESVLNVALTPAPGSYLGRMGTGRLDAAAARAHGAGAVFSGSSGDQIFFEKRRTWPAADFLKLHGFRRGFLRTTLDSARLGHVSFWRAARNAVVDQSFRGRTTQDLGRYVTLASLEARDRAARTMPRTLHPALLAATDLPIGKFHQVDDLICPGEYYDPYLRCASPELVTPLRSQPLLEFCLSVPTYTLTCGGVGRGLARRAFAGVIPPEIAARRSKGSTQDHVTSILRRSTSFVRELLLDGDLVAQGLLDRAKLEVALSDKPTSTQTYASEVHTCVAIEAWLRRLA